MDLRTHRVIKGKKQWDVTRETGIPQTKVSLIENGYVSPSESEKTKIAEALGLAVDQIDWDTTKEEGLCAV